MSASIWQPGMVATVEVALHQGREATDALPVTLVLDRDHDARAPHYLFLNVSPDATWGPILTAATAALRAAGCPEGAITWAGQPDRELEACGCAWVSRELRVPTAGDTETEGADLP